MRGNHREWSRSGPATRSLSLSSILLLSWSLQSLSWAFHPAADAFATRTPARSGHASSHAERKLGHHRHISLLTLQTQLRSNEEQDDSGASLDSDQIRRRQILLAMLAAAGTSTTAFMPPSSAIAETNNNREKRNGTYNIIKPPLDEREYYAFELENGLRVLLCSDPSSNDSGAAMDVHVGAFSDPIEVPGMAHFCEHMLFLGTKPYPQEDSFESFLSSNGGSSNAYTDSLDTVYFFEMETDADSRFLEGLKRFGAFFSAPLFTEAATGRELNAIDSENAKNLQSDAFRYFQLTKARANSEHPFSKFATGNKKTLLDNTKAQNVDLRSELIKFYNQYYSANQMTLAVVAPQEISILKKMVQSAFAEIPNKNRPQPEDSWSGLPPFNDQAVIPSFQSIVEVVPVQDIRQVTVSWPVLYKSYQELQDSRFDKPHQYVAHLMGHEGPGSLQSYLKRRGWANTVAAAVEEELSDFETYEMVVGLTRRGLAEIDSVIEAIYSYISLLRDKPIPGFIFDEVLQLQELQWRFLTKTGAASYLQSLATAMQKYPEPLYVAGPRRLALSDYTQDPPLTDEARQSFPTRSQLEENREKVDKYLENLTVDNAMITVLSKSFENQTDRKEKWYGTDYRIRRVPDSTLERWRNCESPGRLKLNFPKPNPFIPSEAGLQVKLPRAPTDIAKERSFESRMESIPPPKVIRDDGPDGQWTVYFKQDDRFGKPKGFLIFQVQSKEVFSSPTNAALANLFELCVSDRLAEYAYDANLAGLSYDVRVMARGVRLTFGGYNDKLTKFASYISRKLSKDIRDILPRKDNEFDRYKDQTMRALSSFDVKQPYAHAAYYASLVQEPRRFQYSNKDLRAATRKTTLPDLVAYTKGLWSSGKGEALVQGNFDKFEALELVDTITGVLPFKPISINDVPPRVQALPLPALAATALPTCLLVAEPNPSNENACAHILIQNLSASDKDHVLIELIGAIVQEPFYNELRTKKQLGYIVSSGVRGIGDARTLTFIVQSSIAPADSLTVEILKFLDNVEEEILQKISRADLAVYVKSLIDRKTEPEKDLSQEVTRNWAEIASGRLQFDRFKREATALLSVEKDDVIDLWRKMYVANGRRVVITQVIPSQGPASSTIPPESTGYGSTVLPEGTIVLGVDDIDQFRRDRERIASGKWEEIVETAYLR